MAKTAKMNSQLSTSYLTPYTLCGLSRRYLPLYSRNFTMEPIINGVGLCRFCAKLHCENWRSTAIFGAPQRSFFATQVSTFYSSYHYNSRWKKYDKQFLHICHNVLARGRHVWRRYDLNFENSRSRRLWRHIAVVLHITERRFSQWWTEQ